jgi:hypothetical protein
MQLTMKKSQQTIEEMEKLKKEREHLNLGLDADRSSDDPLSDYNNDNDQVSGNSNEPVHSPLDDK